MSSPVSRAALPGAAHVAVLTAVTLTVGAGCTDPGPADDSDAGVDTADIQNDARAWTPTVLPGAGPIVTTPSWGQVADLSRDPCVTLEIAATDADSDTLLFTYEGLPEGAETSDDGAMATVSWCPTSAQIDLRVHYSFVVTVSDGTYAVRRPYTIWLIPPYASPCPGGGARVEVGNSYQDVDGPLRAGLGWSVLARRGLVGGANFEEGVLALYTDGPVADPPDFSTWTVLPTRRLPGTPVGGATGQAWLPPTNYESPPASITIGALSAVNSDPSGATCDRLVWTAQSRAIVGWEELEAPIIGCVVPCGASDECSSGACLQTVNGPFCDHSDRTSHCPERGPMVTVEGTPVEVCLPYEVACVGPEPRALPQGCNRDSFEPNDSVATAALLTVGDSEVAELCVGDVDTYAYDLQPDEVLTLGIVRETNDWNDNQPRNLSLRVIDESGRVLAFADSGYSYHQAPVPLDPSGIQTQWLRHRPSGARSDLPLRVFVEVSGVGEGDRERYRLRSAIHTEVCDDDGAEPNDDATSPTLVASGEVVAGMLCRSDEDWLAIDVATPGVLDVALAFDWSAIDLDAELYDPAGRRIATLVAKQLDERAQVSADVVGRYLLRIRGWAMVGCVENRCDDTPQQVPFGPYTARLTVQR